MSKKPHVCFQFRCVQCFQETEGVVNQQAADRLAWAERVVEAAKKVIYEDEHVPGCGTIADRDFAKLDEALNVMRVALAQEPEARRG